MFNAFLENYKIVSLVHSLLLFVGGDARAGLEGRERDKGGRERVRGGLYKVGRSSRPTPSHCGSLS